MLCDDSLESKLGGLYRTKSFTFFARTASRTATEYTRAGGGGLNDSDGVVGEVFCRWVRHCEREKNFRTEGARESKTEWPRGENDKRGREGK